MTLTKVKPLKKFLVFDLGLKQSMRANNFVFDGVDGLHYKCHKVSRNHGEYYIDSLGWL